MTAIADSFCFYDSPTERSGVCISVSLAGDGRGIFCTPSQREANWLIEAIEKYDAQKCAAEKQDLCIKHLEELNAKLRKRLRRRATK